MLSKLSGWYRLLIVSSVCWIIGALIAIDPWTRYGRRAGNNWDEFLLVGILPIVIFWGLIWIVQGFRKARKKGEKVKDSHDDAKKLESYKEFSNNPDDHSPQIQTTKESSDIASDRVLCADGSCIGTVNLNGICNECGRTIDEINEIAERKTTQASFSRTIPKSLLIRLRITLWVCIITFLLFIVAANLYATYTFENELFSILTIIGSAILIVGNILFLRDIGILAISLKKSSIAWIAGCLFIPIFFHIYAYVHLSGLAHSKFMVSEPSRSR
jgi:hypothetical protein